MYVDNNNIIDIISGKQQGKNHTFVSNVTLSPNITSADSLNSIRKLRLRNRKKE